MTTNFFQSKYSADYNPFTELQSNAMGVCLSSILPQVMSLKNNSLEDEKDFTKSVQKIVLDSIDNSIRGLLVNQVDKMIGENLGEFMRITVKGATSFLYTFSKSLYQYAIGNIEGDELLNNTIGSAIISGTSSLGASAFSFMSNSLGLGASIGAAFGPLGIVFGGAFGALLGTGIVNTARQEGINRVERDLNIINSDLSRSNNIYKYIDVAGSMDRYKFSLKHLIPGYGSLGCVTEYGARKRVLDNIANQLLNKRTHIEENYRAYISQIDVQFKRRCKQLENEFITARNLYFTKTEEIVGQLTQEVNQFLYLKSNYIAALTATHDERIELYNQSNEKVKKRKEYLIYFNVILDDLSNDIKFLTAKDDIEFFTKVLNDISDSFISTKIIMPIKQAEIFLQN